MRICFPERINEQNLLALLNEPLDVLSKMEAGRYDSFAEQIEENCSHKAVFYQVLAARVFDEQMDVNYTAAFGFERAADIANKLDFPMLAFRCLYRARELYLYEQRHLSRKGHHWPKKLQEDLFRTQKKIIETIGKIEPSLEDPPERIYGDDHIWNPWY